MLRLNYVSKKRGIVNHLKQHLRRSTPKTLLKFDIITELVALAVFYILVFKDFVDLRGRNSNLTALNEIIT